MTDEKAAEAEFIAKVSRALEACGIPAEQISVAYEDMLQDYEAVIALPGPALTDQQLDRIVLLSRESPVITFADPSLSQRFHARTSAIYSPLRRASARDWLNLNGLLDGLPDFEPSRHDLAHFARSIETHCGASPGSMLDARTDTLLVLGAADFAVGPESLNVLFCIHQAVLASNVGEHGVSFGVIGGTN